MSLDAVFAALAAAVSLGGYAAGQGVEFVPGCTEIYVADGASAVTRFAAEELKGVLSQSFGRDIPVTNVFIEGMKAIIVGDNAHARAAGIDVKVLPLDAGVIRTAPGRVYIAGFDDPSVKSVDERLHGGIWPNMYERGTVFAVYEFLERFAGVRFYFPGELGTIVPKREALEVPPTDFTNAPDFSHRDYAAWSDGKWFEEGRETNRVLQHYRNRLQTAFIPCSHGLNEMFYLERFGKTHPEFFQQFENGKRNVDPTYPQPGQLCHTSSVWEEIYRDVKSYFTGEPPEKRGIPAAYGKPGCAWNVNTREIKGLGKFADIMPQDAFQPCHCGKCQAAYRKDRKAYATDLIWGNVARLGFRLKEEGIPGTITMMGYFPYSDVPDFPLPDNLLVMVARMGPWSEGNAERAAQEKREIRAWSEKLGKKVWLWNYPCKFRGEFQDIPETAPRAWGKYYKDLSPWIFGAFAQTHSTRWMYNHMNDYVLGKVFWNNRTDVDALLDEYHRFMFGKGAYPMKRFSDALEWKWMRGVVGKTAETPLGPVVVQPGDYELFTRVYSPAFLVKLGKELDAAEAAVPAGSLEARRVALMRRELFEPLKARADKYVESIDVKKALARRTTEPNRSILLNGDFADGVKGWNGKVEADGTCYVTAPASVKIVSTATGNDAYQPLAESARKLKPSTKYRLSFFLKFDNVVPLKKGGGVYGNVYAGGNRWFPDFNGHTGTTDWMYQSFEFTTSPETDVKHKSYISLRLREATGTAWFDDVRLEELPLQKIFAAAMAALPQRPAAPGPESWTFREELAAHEEGAAIDAEGKTPWLKDRISRCFFGPIKRAPYNRDELMDNVDYYPDGYLEKLKRDGVNGLWITVEFHEIVETRFFPRDPNAEKRLEKLRRTVAKCARYGIRVWIFALEPKWLKEEHPFRKANPGMFVQRGDHFAMCPELPEVREYLESAAKNIFTRVPGLGGFIGITHGEDITSCFSYNGYACPRCGNLPQWKMHADIVGALAKGARAADPEARVISWFYQPQAQTKRGDWVYECAAHLPEGVTLMYNFESGSLVKQLDRWRVGGDYWLAQPGPGEPFKKLSETAKASGTCLAAKIQIACSHEDATVPYIPVPGLLYRKFKAMKECGVESAMLSWYFGNYPCIMSKAAGRLAYEDFKDGEDVFLKRLAAEEWGDQADDVAALWKKYSDAYANYPVSNYMQYYGPYHAGLVWALYPQIGMKMLEPTWMPHYKPAGDAIGECLRDFSLDEALALATKAAEMPEPELKAETRARRLDVGVMKAVRRQFLSARNVFDFYRARSQAIYMSRVLKKKDEARKSVARMREILAREKGASREMIPLCEDDSRLGFHSEAEAHQFFPARLKWRIGALELAEKDLSEIDEVLAGGGTYPESEHEKTAPRMYIGDDTWTEGAGGFKCRVYRLVNGDLRIEGAADVSLPSVCIATYDAAATRFPRAVAVTQKGEVISLVWNGEPRAAEDAKAESWKEGNRWAFSLVLSSSAWGSDDRLRPEWAFFYLDGRRSLWPANAEWQKLGRLWHPLSPSQFGRLVYAKPTLPEPVK